FHTTEGGRVICHSAVVRVEDAESSETQDLRRWLAGEAADLAAAPPLTHYGFSHLLLDVPSTVDAQQVLMSWSSDQWQRSDPGTAAALPEMLYLPVAARLDDAGLAAFMANAAQRDLVQFVLAAYLTTPSSTRIFLAVAPELMIWSLYALCRAFPQTLVEELTFSSYESEPVSVSARLVATSWADPTGRDLPATCYDGLGVGFNLYSGTKTAVNTSKPFVEFALESLASGKPVALDEFRATWHRLGVKGLGMLDLVYRLDRGTGEMTKEESRAALADPALAAWVAGKPEPLGQMLEWSFDDLDYATSIFSRAIVPLRQKPEVLAKLGSTVLEIGTASLRGGNLPRTRNALEVLLPMVAPAKAAGVWQELIQGCSDPGAMTWEMRAYLLPRLAKLKPLQLGQTPDAEVQRWLTLSDDHLAEFLRLELPQPYLLAATLQALGDSERWPAVVRALADHHALVLPLLGQLAAQPGGADRAVSLFEAILAESSRPWAEDLVRHGRLLPTPVLDRCLLAALQAPSADVVGLVRGQGVALVDRLAGQASLERIAQVLLGRPGAELLADQAFEQFLAALGPTTTLSESVRRRLDDFLAVRAFLQKPELSRDTLRRVAQALQATPELFSSQVRDRVVAVAAGPLRSGQPGVMQDLENVLLALGLCYSGGPSELYRVLHGELREDRNFWRTEELVHAFMALSLDASQVPEVNAELNGLDDSAYALVQGMRHYGGPKLVAAIDKRTETWPRPARRQWVFLTQSGKPASFQGPLRDLLMVAIGTGLAALVFFILRQLQWL
ncbi:MAG TPA: hypothetical protein PKC45_06975, partial [Gemmatales bacterium]|nr:hypothetical protein [Gemmatales bacterium]